MRKIFKFLLVALVLLPVASFASEADLVIQEFSESQRNLLMYGGFTICFLGILFSLNYYIKILKLESHHSMKSVSQIIWETCKVYMNQQGKFLVLLFLIVGSGIVYYFKFLRQMEILDVGNILFWCAMGVAGSYGVAWFGIRVNTLANSRMPFAALRGNPLALFRIPINAGMSIGVLLVCIELMMMMFILLLIPGESAGACFIGFAIGESLGASALRIAGGIFTKIADIGADLMKIFFKIREDDPRNPGVIADCVGDNAGDSVGPTADGFETYGVTGVALISFIVLGIALDLQTDLIVWIFAIRIAMIVASIASFWLNNLWIKLVTSKRAEFDYEDNLTSLVWITCIVSIVVTFIVSYFLIGPNSHFGATRPHLWKLLSTLITLGTLAAGMIPELTKVFSSMKSRHVQEVVNASKEGGASLNILSGLVAGDMSAFWIGMCYAGFMVSDLYGSTHGLSALTAYPAIFAFGLSAFGMLGMGPVTIAVDSYGPVTDNAQSVFELSGIENRPGIKEEICRDFGFYPDFEGGKEELEKNDSAGNTFKATAKPVLIGTAVIGSTTMIFALVLTIKNVLGVEPESVLNFLNAWSIIGLVCGGCVIFWFSGATVQAVVTGAYRGTKYCKEHIVPEEELQASIQSSKAVVKICTQAAQKGMANIFPVIFSFTLAFAFLSATQFDGDIRYGAISLFVSYLIGLAIFGLLQAIFMANSGATWDNAKKFVEVKLKLKRTPLHDASVIGDTVGDPFKDTSSVAINPIIKFSTLFGLLAIEIAIDPNFIQVAPYYGVGFLLIGLYFVYRSFYKMRINVDKEEVVLQAAA